MKLLNKKSVILLAVVLFFFPIFTHAACSPASIDPKEELDQIISQQKGDIGVDVATLESNLSDLIPQSGVSYSDAFGILQAISESGQCFQSGQVSDYVQGASIITQDISQTTLETMIGSAFWSFPVTLPGDIILQVMSELSQWTNSMALGNESTFYSAAMNQCTTAHSLSDCQADLLSCSAYASSGEAFPQGMPGCNGEGMGSNLLSAGGWLYSENILFQSPTGISSTDFYNGAEAIYEEQKLSDPNNLTATENNLLQNYINTIENSETPIPVATLQSISITTPANKLTYNVDNSLDLTGLVVTGTYSDGSKQVENITTSNVTGFDSSVPAVGQVLTITFNGQTTSYTINVVAIPSSDTTLSSLAISSGLLSPVFSPTQNFYNVILPAGTTAIPTVTAVTNDSKATDTIVQVVSLPGSATITVTAQDGTTVKTYTINFGVSSPGEQTILWQMNHNCSNDTANYGEQQSLGSGITGIFNALEVYGTSGSDPSSVSLSYANQVSDFYGYGSTGGTVTKISFDSVVSNGNNLYTYHLNTPYTFDPTKYYMINFGQTTEGSCMNDYSNGSGEWDGLFGAFNLLNNNPALAWAFGSDYNSSFSAGTGTGMNSPAHPDYHAINPIINAYFRIYFAHIDPTLKGLVVNGTALNNFSQSKTGYNFLLPAGTTVIPIVSAITNDPEATYVVTQATSPSGSAKILVTAGDGITTETYTIHFGVAPAGINTILWQLNHDCSSETANYGEQQSLGSGITGTFNNLDVYETSGYDETSGSDLSSISLSYANQVSDFYGFNGTNGTVTKINFDNVTNDGNNLYTYHLNTPYTFDPTKYYMINFGKTTEGSCTDSYSNGNGTWDGLFGAFDLLINYNTPYTVYVWGSNLNGIFSAGTGTGMNSPANPDYYTINPIINAYFNFYNFVSIPTISVGNSPLAYNGSAQIANIISSVPGIISNVEYNGSTTAPTVAGIYKVTADFAPTDSAHYSSLTGGSAGTFTISPAPAIVTLSSLLQFYDGAGESATVTTVPSGLSASVTYNGSTTPPTDTGSYTVVATVNDTDYTGAATSSLTIGPAPLGVNANNQSKLYGAPDPVLTYTHSILAIGDTDMVFSGFLSRVAGEDVGTYAINQGTLSAGGNYNLAFVSGTLTIGINPSNSSVDIATSSNPDGTISGTVPSATQATTTSNGFTATFTIPSDITITGASTWDGSLTLPVSTTTYTAPSTPGYNTSVVSAIEVGAGSTPLTLNEGVRIDFVGQTGTLVGWSRNGVFTPITTTCSTDSQIIGDALTAGGDCMINVGHDLIVWTKHFTTFITYTQIPTLQVHILKYLDGKEATAASANNYQFPMTATAFSVDINGTNTYVLGDFYGGATDQYGASTAAMDDPTNYTTAEVTNDTNTSSKVLPINATCVAGDYRLDGYQTSAVSFADAAVQTVSALPPIFTGVSVDQYVIVNNETCPMTGSLTIQKNTIGGNGTFKFNGDGGIGSFSIITSGTKTGGTGTSQTFSNLKPGTYHITESSQSGWTMTDNECAAAVVIAGDPAVCIITNTNNKLLGEIRGTKYEDIDGDGTLKDGDHNRIAGVTVYLDLKNDSKLDSGDPTSVTDSHGNYDFVGLAAAKYTVREVVPTGWIETVPSSGSYIVTVEAGQIVKNKNFGDFKLDSISGMKFNDINGNGRKDKGDIGLSGWTITLKGQKGVSQTTTTDANGNYSFSNLGPGVYTLSEVQQKGWNQTTSPSLVWILSGTNSKNDNFGNTQRSKNKYGGYWGN